MGTRTPRRADLAQVGDRQLAALAAAGDEEAFEAIFERHHSGLLSLSRYLLGSPEEAEDAVQHTFAAAYRQLVEREPPEHLRAWLYTTARNRCLDVLRTRREVPAVLSPASTAGLSDEVERRSELRDLVDDIGRLPEDQRAALVMSEIDELQHAEVAEVLGCPRDKVRALVFQARSSLSGWREARALPCRDVRQELAVARGGALRQGHLRRHLKLCPECAAFRADVDRQRHGLALVLPVVATLGFKERVLEAALGAVGAGAGGSVAGGGAAAGGGLAASLGPIAMKVGVAALVLGGGVATFAGSMGGGPGERAPSGAPALERSAAAERRDVVAMADPVSDSTSKRLRERAVVETTEPDQAGAEVPETPQAPAAAPASSQPAPQSPGTTTQSPGTTTQSPGTDTTLQVPDALPDVEGGVDVGVEVEVEVDPPPLP
jgi:RNA polymerase sigma factor (sigma-70 family)